VTARDLAAWAADAFAGYDVAATHRIVTAVCGPGPLPDYVSARVDPVTGLVALPRPVGVVRACGVRAGGLVAVVRQTLLTRNALIASGDISEMSGVGELARRAESAGAPSGVLQVADGDGRGDFVLEPAADGPVVVIVDGEAGLIDPGATVIDAHGDLGRAVRAARAVLRETGGDRVRVHSADPGAVLRVAAALPVTRVAAGDEEMPPPPLDRLVTWTRISGAALTTQPWATPRGPVPAYPYASNASA
jgi:hypothetical protein